MGLGHKCLRRDYILEAAEDSLRRLNVEAIDLYQSHWDDETTAFDETLEAYALLMKQGKVRAIGASNLTAGRLAAALSASDRAGLPRYATLQPHYNLYERQSFEGPLQELCIREGLGVIPYFALASGFLTGKYRSEADFGQEPARRWHAQVPQSARLAHPRGARRRGRAVRRDAGADRARVAHGAPGRHGADRQRDVGRATRRLARGDTHRAGRRRAAHARRRERAGRIRLTRRRAASRVDLGSRKCDDRAFADGADAPGAKENRPMARYRFRGNAPQVPESAYVADDATLIGRVVLGERTSVWPHAVIRADSEPIVIGEGSNVQDGAVLHVDPGVPMQIGRNVTVGHQVMLHGCTIGDGSLIGIQAIVLNHAVIGAESLVGAGAIVTEGKTFPERSLILGAPAKVVRALTDADLAMLRHAAETYMKRREYYKTELERID